MKNLLSNIRRTLQELLFNISSRSVHLVCLSARVEALRILVQVDAIPIAAGGIGGAEGSIILLVKGSEEQVKKAMSIVEKIKGEPQVKEPK
jgi:hypothetical protein